jgi:hypothetical protein
MSTIVTSSTQETYIGCLDLPVRTEGRAARCRRSACVYAAPQSYGRVIPRVNYYATWETGNIGFTSVAREGK